MSNAEQTAERRDSGTANIARTKQRTRALLRSREKQSRIRRLCFKDVPTENEDAAMGGKYVL